MKPSLFQVVAAQLKSGSNKVRLGSRELPVTRTSVKGLRKVEFIDQGRKIVAIEQNPKTGSKWADMARRGSNVVQFKDSNKDRYIAVSVNGRVQRYK